MGPVCDWAVSEGKLDEATTSLRPGVKKLREVLHLRTRGKRSKKIQQQRRSRRRLPGTLGVIIGINFST